MTVIQTNEAADRDTRSGRTLPQWLVVGALLFAACGGSDDDATPEVTTGSSTAITAAPNTTTTSPTNTPATTVAVTTVPATTAPPTTVPATTPPPTTVRATTVPVEPPSIAALVASGDVLNIAHAGGDQDYPHSTMYAFSQAVASGADVLEMDIRVTADGVVVVHHDADTTKTTPETLVIADTDLATLQALDKAYWFSPECWGCRDLPVESYVFRGVRTGDIAPPDGFTADDFRLLTLAEVSEAFPGLALDIEIKDDGDAALLAAEALANELTRLDRLESTIVVSFDSLAVARFHELAPTVATSPGVDEMTAWILGGEPLADFHAVVQIPPFFGEVEVLNQATLDLAAASGVAVWVWPNDVDAQENEQFYRTLIEMGVTGILGGRPAQVEAAIRG